MASAGLQGYFFGLPAATLSTLLTQYTNCLTAIAVAGQSYTVSGRQFTRANLAEVGQMIMELNAALSRANGTQVTQTYAKFSNSNNSFVSGANGNLT